MCRGLGVPCDEPRLKSWPVMLCCVSVLMSFLFCTVISQITHVILIEVVREYFFIMLLLFDSVFARISNDVASYVCCMLLFICGYFYLIWRPVGATWFLKPCSDLKKLFCFLFLVFFLFPYKLKISMFFSYFKSLCSVTSVLFMLFFSPQSTLKPTGHLTSLKCSFWLNDCLHGWDAVASPQLVYTILMTWQMKCVRALRAALPHLTTKLLHLGLSSHHREEIADGDSHSCVILMQDL